MTTGKHQVVNVVFYFLLYQLHVMLGISVAYCASCAYTISLFLILPQKYCVNEMKHKQHFETNTFKSFSV
jgi:hypothetical protein